MDSSLSVSTDPEGQSEEMCGRKEYRQLSELFVTDSSTKADRLSVEHGRGRCRRDRLLPEQPFVPLL
jgi:hypothetical protein